MTYKWIGAVLVVVGCGGFGFSMARETLRQEALLHQTMNILENMEGELRCRLTPLPQLCKGIARRNRGSLGKLFAALYKALRDQQEPQAEDCLRILLREDRELPVNVKRVLQLLARSLGRFDLEGQLQTIASAKALCRRELSAIRQDQDIRLRGYRTLGLCAGAALAVLLL